MNPPVSKRRGIGAGLTGATTGTAVLHLAKVISDDHPLISEVAIYAAPTVSVIAGTIAFFCIKAYKQWDNNRRLKSAKNKFNEVAAQAMANTHLSNEKKALIMEKVADVHVEAVVNEAENIKYLQNQKMKLESNEF